MKFHLCDTFLCVPVEGRTLKEDKPPQNTSYTHGFDGFVSSR